MVGLSPQSGRGATVSQLTTGAGEVCLRALWQRKTPLAVQCSLLSQQVESVCYLSTHAFNSIHRILSITTEGGWQSTFSTQKPVYMYFMKRLLLHNHMALMRAMLEVSSSWKVPSQSAMEREICCSLSLGVKWRVSDASATTFSGRAFKYCVHLSL